MNQPKVIFFDAVGTLFGVRGNVGKVYADVAQKFGVTVLDETVNQAFLEVFSASEPPIFPNAEKLEIPYREFEWWKAIAFNTFSKVEVIEQFSDFNGFFDELYAHFATAKPWFVYDDVLEAIAHWQNLGIQLGIISNFDSRIYQVLAALNLQKFFTSITISSQTGTTKPEPQIFAIALQKHNCIESEAWHIGDSYKEDYQAATIAGLRGVWLKRE